MDDWSGNQHHNFQWSSQFKYYHILNVVDCLYRYFLVRLEREKRYHLNDIHITWTNNKQEVISMWAIKGLQIFHAQSISIPYASILLNNYGNDVVEKGSKQRTCVCLTHVSLDKIAAISQTIFSDAFSWMKNVVFWVQFHWCLFQLTITQHWFR